MTLFNRIKRQEIVTLFVLLLSAFTIRILFGISYLNYFDIGGYNIPWALASREGLLQIYSNAENLDYPPVFPALLSVLADKIAWAVEFNHWHLQMFYMKLVPILFDTMIAGGIYLVAREYQPARATAFSMIWVLNPTALFNCSFWGQTDSMLMFFLLFLFYSLQKHRAVSACIFFALGCLTKLQMAYFAPVLLLELFCCYPLKRALASLGIGLGVGIAGWLPFIIGSHNWKLPFEIYLGGFDSYPYIVLNAYNLYGALGLNEKPDQSSMLGPISYQTGSSLIAIFLLLLLIVGYLFSRKRRLCLPPVFFGALFFNSVFMLTIRQHERYQIPVVLLFLLCLLFTNRKEYLFLFVGSAIFTTINQATLLFSMNFHGVYQQFQQSSVQVFSIVNFLLFLYSVLVSAKYFLSALRRPIPVKLLTSGQ